MVIDQEIRNENLHLLDKARKIKLVLTDIDGVLTDSGVYYSADGEKMKRFSIRDGMGVERLKDTFNIETGIITGENSGSVKTRADKLKITELHLGIQDKPAVLSEILDRKKLKSENIAFIGDDINDYKIIEMCGLTASPNDGMRFIKNIVDFVCNNNGGNGAFREFVELIIALNYNK